MRQIYVSGVATLFGVIIYVLYPDFLVALAVTTIATLAGVWYVRRPRPSVFERRLRRGLCPDCGKGHLIQGPSGGFSVNCLCDNPTCGHEFNIAVTNPPFLLDHLGTPSAQRRLAIYGIK